MNDKKPILNTDERFPDVWMYTLCVFAVIAVVAALLYLSMQGNPIARWVAGC